MRFDQKFKIYCEIVKPKSSKPSLKKNVSPRMQSIERNRSPNIASKVNLTKKDEMKYKTPRAFKSHRSSNRASSSKGSQS